MRRISNWIAVCWMLCAGSVIAQTVEQGIIVTGEGRVSLAPDMARITLGAEEIAPNAAEAVSEVNATVASILEQLDALGIAPEQRQTTGLYLHPIVDRSANHQGPVKGTTYRAGNQVLVEVRDLDRLGDILDGAVGEGATKFGGLSFGLQNADAARAEARALAVADAMERAAQLAQAAGVTLGAVTRITEGSFGGAPVMMEMAAARSGFGEAIASGEVDVSAQVTMVFEIAKITE